MSLLFPKKILIMCATGAHNLWDELILRWEIQYLRQKYGEHAIITVCTYDPTSAIIHDDKVYFASYFPNNFRRRPLRNIAHFFQNIWLLITTDVLIVGWGGIIFDNEPWVSFSRLFWQWHTRIWLARLFRVEILFWGISLEVEEPSNQMQLSQLFVPWDHILVRDNRSKSLLDALDVPSRLAHDIVFLYEPPLAQRSFSREKLVGISVRWGFLGYNEEVILDIYDSLVENGYKPIFLVFSTDGVEAQNDALFIQNLMLGKSYNITKSIVQTLDVYPFLYAVIGMRLHAGILACVHEIPYLPISYWPKTDELINLLDIEHLALSASRLTLELFQSRWTNLLWNYEIEKIRMKEKHTEIRDGLYQKLETV